MIQHLLLLLLMLLFLLLLILLLQLLLLVLLVLPVILRLLQLNTGAGALLCCRQYLAWRVGWDDQKRSGSSSKLVLLTWGLFSLLLPAVALAWGLGTYNSGIQQHQQQEHLWVACKKYTAVRLMLQLCGEATLLMLVPYCSTRTSTNNSNRNIGSHKLDLIAETRLRRFLRHLFHLR